MADDVSRAESKDRVIEIRGDDAYELLQVRAIQNVETAVLQRLRQAAAVLGILVTLATVVAAVFGLSSLSNYVQTTVAAAVERAVQQRVDQRLGKLEERIDLTLEKGVLAKGTSEQALATIQKVEDQVTASSRAVKSVSEAAGSVHGTLNQLRSDISKQQKDMELTRTQLADLFASLRTEVHDVVNSKKLQLVPAGPKRAILVVRLDATPVRGSVRLQWHLFAQPPNSYAINKNVLVFNWGDDVPKLTTQQLYVSYAADSTATERLGDLASRSDGIYAGEVRVFP
jgi:hypothetical protein